MKKYKKILLLIILFLLSTTISVRAEGATAEVTLTPSATSAKAGETIEVKVSVKCETGVEGIDAILTWDKTKLEFINSEEIATTGYSSMSGIDESTNEKLFKMSIMCISEETPKEAEVAVLKFKVLDTAKTDEELSIKLSKIMVANTAFEEITIEDKEIKLKITGNQIIEEEKKEDEKVPVQEEEKKDDTTANKPINNAGIEKISVISIFFIILVSIILYNKLKKYKDVK